MNVEGTMNASGTALPRAAFAMQSDLQHSLFDTAAMARFARIVDLDPSVTLDDISDTGSSAAEAELLAEVEVLVTAWGAPVIGRHELERMPRLRAVFHAAGTVKGHLMPAVWDRGILVTTAAAANAYPVAEYTLAMILLAGKGVLPIIREYRSTDQLDVSTRFPDIGNYGRTVGIIGASTVGRLVIDLLAPFDFEVLVYDPLLDPSDPILGTARRVEMHELLRLSSIVSVHAPLLRETRGMIGAEQLAMMRQGATLINTARAPIIDQAALVAAVTAGRIRAVLDVTEPEPLPLGDPLRSLDAVLLTPHVAGALGNELLRLGESALHEAELWAAGKPPAHPVLQSDLVVIA